MHKHGLYILTAPSFLPSNLFVMVLYHHVFVFPSQLLSLHLLHWNLLHHACTAVATSRLQEVHPALIKVQHPLQSRDMQSLSPPCKQMVKLSLRLLIKRDIMKICGGVEVCLHEFLTSALHLGQWPLPRSAQFTCWKLTIFTHCTGG
jgi:hypothetical protein